MTTLPPALLSLLQRNAPTALDGPKFPPGWCSACSQAPCLCPSCHGAGLVRADDPTAYPLGVVQQECTSCGIVAGRRLAALEELSVLRDFEAATFDTFEARPGLEEALVRAQAFAASPQGWLVLQGDVGCGKTHLAAAAGNALRGRGELVAMHVMPALMAALRRAVAASVAGDKTQSEAADKLIWSLKSVPILILDDLGAQRDTDYAVETAYQIVEARYRRQLPMIVTTNVFNGLEPRVRDRLGDEALSVVVAIRHGTQSYRQMPVKLRRGAA